ncbi:MAG TPA: OmpH family outer membrane protein [Bacteroidota bacterium]|nr:OmpH family outer membrane protein [Bacteroidota bacterium]
MNTRVLPLLAAVILLGGGLAGAQQRIAYVNSSKIFQEYPAAQDAQKRIDAIGKPMQDSLEGMQKDLQARVDEYQKKEALFNDATKKSEQQRLLDLERAVQEYRVAKFGQDGELAKETERIINPIRDRIKAAIAVVAKEEHYNFVFDKTDQIQILLYGDAKDDITFKVIDKLKRGK